MNRGTELSGSASWRNWLVNDPLLTPGLRESYRRTLAGFVAGTDLSGLGVAVRALPGKAAGGVGDQRGCALVSEPVGDG